MEKVCDWSSVSKVVCEVLCWRFLTGLCPRSGRPVEVDSDQIETLIEKSQCYTTWKIANILKISKSIKLLVKVKNVSFMGKTIGTFLPTQYSCDYLTVCSLVSLWCSMRTWTMSHTVSLTHHRINQKQAQGLTYEYSLTEGQLNLSFTALLSHGFFCDGLILPTRS